MEGGCSSKDSKQIAKGWKWFEEGTTDSMPQNRKRCGWAIPKCSHEYEPPHYAANEVVRLYHAAVVQ